jgi:CheY-like chemotaxis protein
MSSTASQLGQGPFVVIAEDDDDIRECLAEVLVADGFRVRAVSDGELLADLLDECHHRDDLPDVLVTDHRMPAYTGLEVLEALGIAGWHIPTIVLTAFGKDVRRIAEAHGALVVFDKPFDVEELRTSIYWAVDWNAHQLWRMRRERAESASPTVSAEPTRTPTAQKTSGS